MKKIKTALCAVLPLALLAACSAQKTETGGETAAYRDTASATDSFTEYEGADITVENSDGDTEILPSPESLTDAFDYTAGANMSADFDALSALMELEKSAVTKPGGSEVKKAFESGAEAVKLACDKKSVTVSLDSGSEGCLFAECPESAVTVKNADNAVLLDCASAEIKKCSGFVVIAAEGCGCVIYDAAAAVFCEGGNSVTTLKAAPEVIYVRNNTADVINKSGETVTVIRSNGLGVALADGERLLSR